MHDLASRRRLTRRARGRSAAVAVASVFAILLVGQPAWGAIPSLPPVPSLAVPTVPLPTLPPLPLSTPTLAPTPTLPPVPTLPPLPTLSPLPTLPLPTLLPTPSLPLPSILPTASPRPTASAVTTASPGPTSSPRSSDQAATASPGPTLGGSPGPSLGDGAAVGIPLAGTLPSQAPTSSGGGDPYDSVDQGPSPLDFLVPGIVAGVPILIIVIIVIVQLVGGAAWLPMVRRWSQQRLTDLGRRPPL